jgi:hypothetical protein
MIGSRENTETAGMIAAARGEGDFELAAGFHNITGSQNSRTQ